MEGVRISRLFSAHATKVEICLFDALGKTELERLALPEYTDQVWHGYIPDVHPGAVYGIRVHGPLRAAARASIQSEQAASRSLRPRPHRQISNGAGGLWLHARIGASRFSFDERDSAPNMPKCVVVDPNFDWQGQPRTRGVSWDRTVIYEAHVKGFTKLHPAVPDHQKGTYAGLGTKTGGRVREIVGRDLDRAYCPFTSSSTTTTCWRKA
jgi:isoamylase